MDNEFYTDKWVKFGIRELDDLFRHIRGEKTGIPRGSSVIRT